MPIASVVHAHTNGTLEVRVLPFNENMIAKRADKWTTARTLTFSGDVTGNIDFDGSVNVNITTILADDIHIQNVLSDLQENIGIITTIEEW